MTSFPKLAAAVAVATFLAAPVFAETIVKVDLWDAGSDLTMVDDMRIVDHADMSKAQMGLKLSVATIPAGEVTFKVTNSSIDLQHEMVLASVKKLSDGLPYEADTGRVNEEADNANIGEVSELDPGKSGTLTLVLKPGTYVLYCNVAGHYVSGMWTVLTVK